MARCRHEAAADAARWHGDRRHEDVGHIKSWPQRAARRCGDGRCEGVVHDKRRCEGVINSKFVGRCDGVVKWLRIKIRG
jgi:hypothetical protein